MKLVAAKTQYSSTWIRKSLLAWYSEHRRDLPWRRTRDPYAIWVSEIMLQQTRVAAVLEHYREFLLRFPTVEALATSSEHDVLAAWSGLGYYRRARAMRNAAIKIVEEFGGKLPENSKNLQNLPGIGRYTAAAIASIAFNEPVAVVDGNVERVLARLDGVERNGESVWQRAQQLMHTKAPGDWNQAMMELGATVCTPAAPACQACPLRKACASPGRDTRQAQAPRIKKQLVYGVARRGDKVFLRQRAADASLMGGMWELPEVAEPSGHELLTRVKHSITVTDYTVMAVELPAREAKKGKWFAREELRTLALTGLTRKILKKIGAAI